jgi:hypothetical protein
MTMHRNRARRLRSAVNVARRIGRTVFRHSDGAELSLPDRQVVDLFLDDGADPAAPLPLSPAAVAFLAETEVRSTMPDVEASLIEQARDEVERHRSASEPETAKGTNPHLADDRPQLPGLTRPGTDR